MAANFPELEESIALESLVRRGEERFVASYGRRPRWVVASPGRVNLIGEHTDYNDGFVLPMAIDRYVVLAADRPPSTGGGPADAGSIRLRSEVLDASATISADGSATAEAPGWTSYIRGVVGGMRGFGLDAGPLDILIDASLPLGGGLSSSAALEVSTATLIEAIHGCTIDPLEKAKLCQKAEQEAAGVPCGIMDQFSTIMGRPACALLLDCRSLRAESVPLSDLSVALMVVNSRVKHALADGAYAERRTQCESVARSLGVAALRDVTLDRLEAARGELGPIHFRRARHVVSENARTVEAASAFRDSNWSEAGRLMNSSHASLRDDFEVSCTELDWLVDRAGSIPGVIGARMTGGGFGGCAVMLVQGDAAHHIGREISVGYQERWGIEPAAFLVRAVGGAGAVGTNP